MLQWNGEKKTLQKASAGFFWGGRFMTAVCRFVNWCVIVSRHFTHFILLIPALWPHRYYLKQYKIHLMRRLSSVLFSIGLVSRAPDVTGWGLVQESPCSLSQNLQMKISTQDTSGWVSAHDQQFHTRDPAVEVSRDFRVFIDFFRLSLCLRLLRRWTNWTTSLSRQEMRWWLKCIKGHGKMGWS